MKWDIQSLALSKELFEKLTIDTDDKVCILRFGSDQESINENYFISNEKDKIEIICFKKTFFRVFKEAHDYFYKVINTKSNFLQDESLIEGTYLCTIGLLLTTPENKTIIRIHEDIVKYCLKSYDAESKLKFINNEIAVVEKLLTSSNNKLNKSSSLWTLYKKLFMVSSEFKENISLHYLSVFMSSANLHFSNYYSWNTLRWFYDLLGNNEKIILFDKTKQFCFKNMRDCSAWDTLADMACKSDGEITHNIQEYNRFRSNYGIGSTYIEDQNFLGPKIASLIDELVDYIDLCEVNGWPPYLCLMKCISSHNDKEIISKIFEKWDNSIECFIEKNPEVTLHGCKLEVISDSLFINRLVEVFNMKLKFIKKIKNS
ncbi:hypothetical protein TPHA_0G03370 [Tetrapisispora phaffii CBS 4417]|uniref:Uncharacterized protein n=1 Tax=Tetrapisispora phaffii (strain ATCC 24235 / CBS 4417 / NBRC 1672 / NRRL Y-8282 / UCD 70-5) TaxID=1071381 RepID=G8BW99_TETPH|nr:hypothetical protein TPHA_0G03370 [Tetrapisispora phaffii CBS 4417]CCE64177.1 hypothetical protein TPHA_0G03370 [Tetrapisispora phaffii CBS 4417]